MSNRILVSEIAVELFTRSELEAVLAHEGAHLREKHLAKNLLFSLGMAWGLCFMFGSLSDLLAAKGLEVYASIAWVPVSLACMAVLLWIQRRNERIADRVAVERGTDAEALISALEKLHKHNVTGRRCPLLDRVFSTHPCMEERASLIRSIDRPHPAPPLDLSLKVV